jgi:hypothetical protein
MLMHTYTTKTHQGELPSNRYGTIEAIRKRFGPKVKIVDALPLEVEPKDCCPYWPGFARKGYRAE